MTTDIERQFFETFGIEPKWKSEQCDGWMRTTAVAYFTNLEEAKKFGIVFQEEPEYPQITDTHYLQLLCLFTKEMNCFTVYDEDVNGLKEAILKDFILDNGYFSKQGIKELFKECE